LQVAKFTTPQINVSPAKNGNEIRKMLKTNLTILKRCQALKQEQEKRNKK